MTILLLWQFMGGKPAPSPKLTTRAGDRDHPIESSLWIWSALSGRSCESSKGQNARCSLISVAVLVCGQCFKGKLPLSIMSKDLKKERLQASFPSRELTELLFGGAEEVEKRKQIGKGDVTCMPLPAYGNSCQKTNSCQCRLFVSNGTVVTDRGGPSFWVIGN